MPGGFCSLRVSRVIGDDAHAPHATPLDPSAMPRSHELLQRLRAIGAGLPRVFWFLWLGTLVNRLGIFVVPFLTLFLTRERGFSAAQATLAVSLYGIGSFVSQFLGGWLSDHVGRRPTIVVSMIATSMLLLVLAFASSLAAIAGLTLALGLATDLYRPASAAIISDVVPHGRRAEAFALRYWAINLGAAIGLALAGLLATVDYLWLFVGDAVTTLAFGAIVIAGVPETRPVARVPASASDPAVPPAAPAPRGLLPFMLLFALCSLLTAAVFVQSDVTVPLAMVAQGLSEAQFGFAAALNGLLIVVFSLGLNRRLDRHPRFLVLALSSLLIGIGFGGYAFAQGFAAWAAGVVVWTFGEMIGSPLSATIVAELAPQHRRGTYQGLLGASYGLAAFVGPVLGGLVFQHAGPHGLWGGCFVLCALVALAYAGILQPAYARLRVAVRET